MFIRSDPSYTGGIIQLYKGLLNSHRADLSPTACVSSPSLSHLPLTRFQKHSKHGLINVTWHPHELWRGFQLTKLKKQGRSNHLRVSDRVLSAYFIVDTHIYWINESVNKPTTPHPVVWLQTRLHTTLLPKEMWVRAFFPNCIQK